MDKVILQTTILSLQTEKKKKKKRESRRKGVYNEAQNQNWNNTLFVLSSHST